MFKYTKHLLGVFLCVSTLAVANDLVAKESSQYEVGQFPWIQSSPSNPQPNPDNRQNYQPVPYNPDNFQNQQYNSPSEPLLLPQPPQDFNPHGNKNNSSDSQNA